SVWGGVLFRAPADCHQPAAKRQPPQQCAATDTGYEPGWRNLSLSGHRTAALRLDQPAHRAGLGFAATPADGAGCRSSQCLGGTKKQYEVEVDLHKLDAYSITLPQVVSAIGNANVNVGGRTINVGQQSVNVRGVGLMDSGGSADLTRGFNVADIENVLLSQSNGVPVFVKDV